MKELGHDLTAGEFAEWMAYASLEPFGDVQADHRAAVGHWITALAHRSSDSRAPAFVDMLDMVRPPDEREVALRKTPRPDGFAEARMMGRMLSKIGKALGMKSRSVSARKSGGA